MTAAPPESPRFFRFVPMTGGHANDSDEIVCHVRWDTEDDLLGILRTCGATPEPLPAGAVLPVHGVPITPETVFPQNGAPAYRATHRGVVLGVTVHFDVRTLASGPVVNLALFGADGSWQVTATDWHNAIVVERELLRRGLVLHPGDHLGRSIDGGPETWLRR